MPTEQSYFSITQPKSESSCNEFNILSQTALGEELINIYTKSFPLPRSCVFAFFLIILSLLLYLFKFLFHFIFSFVEEPSKEFFSCQSFKKSKQTGRSSRLFILFHFEKNNPKVRKHFQLKEWNYILHLKFLHLSPGVLSSIGIGVKWSFCPWSRSKKQISSTDILFFM